jgi:hypothetical protein
MFWNVVVVRDDHAGHKPTSQILARKQRTNQENVYPRALFHFFLRFQEQRCRHALLPKPIRSLYVGLKTRTYSLQSTVSIRDCTTSIVMAIDVRLALTEGQCFCCGHGKWNGGSGGYSSSLWQNNLKKRWPTNEFQYLIWSSAKVHGRIYVIITAVHNASKRSDKVVNLARGRTMKHEHEQ